MKQMVLTAHNGVNLQYPLESLADFCQQHAAGTPAAPTNLLTRLRDIFDRDADSDGFLVLGLDEEDQLIGVLVVEGGTEKRLLGVVIHPDWQRQGCGSGLIRSAKMLSRGTLRTDLAPNAPVADFFIKMGFSVEGQALALIR